MTAHELLVTCRQAGINLVADGDCIDVDAPAGVLTPERRSELARHKSALLALLAPPRAFVTLHRGPTLPVEAIALALNLERRGFRMSLDGCQQFQIEPATTLGDRETAERVARAIREKLAKGELGVMATSDGQTLDTYATTWLGTMTGTLKASTVGFYEGHLRQHVFPALGPRPVASIRRQDCRELIVGARAKGLRLATVKGILRALSTVLSQAVEDDILPANPALRMGRYLKQGDEPAPEIQPLTRDEATHLLEVAQTHFPRWYPLLLCALRTGMRQGELLAVRWADLDFAGRFVAVNQNLVRGILTTPKNHQRRRVDMSTQLLETLAALSLRERARALAAGTTRSALVFPSTEGTFLDEANVRKAFHRVLSRAGLRRVRFHDLRHTFASLLIQNGESLAYVRDQMGHRSIQVTVDIYGHLVPGGNRAAVDRLDDTSLHVTPRHRRR